MSGAAVLEEARVAALEHWLTAALNAGPVRVEVGGRLSGGAISLNLAVTLHMEDGAAVPAVLRMGAASGVEASLGKVQEAAVLTAAHATGARVPEPLAVCDDPAVLGAPFFLMRRAEGVAAGRKVVKAEAPQRDLARDLGRQLGLIHRVRPGAEGLAFLRQPAPSPALQCVADYRAWMGRFADTDPALAYGLRWMTLNAPPAGDLVLCHRDYRTGNYLAQDGALTAIIDWEFAGWSDPMEDLGWFCAASWRFGQTDRPAGGLADRADVFAGYEETAGRRVDAAAVDYWQVAAELRWAAIALQQARRHTSGEEPSLELALTGRMLPEIEDNMLRQIDALARGGRT